MSEQSLKFISGNSCRLSQNSIYPTGKTGFGEIVYVTEGVLHICEEWYEYTVEAGKILLLDSNKRHYGSRDLKSDAAFYRIVFSGNHGMPQLAGSAEKIFSPSHPDRINSITSMMTLYSSMPEYPAEMTNSLLVMLFVELFVHGIERDDSHTSHLCGRICDIIVSRGGAVRASEVAAEIGYSADYITRVFRGFYSRGLKAYIDDVRILAIKNMISGGFDIKEIAAQAGFSSVRAMRDFFRYNTDESIGDYINDTLS